ncbi:MAG: hypothetical protein KKB13_05245 [Chloroflexi bacterium]|nr:hypothetical protein [Chloroflexota bacterium]
MIVMIVWIACIRCGRLFGRPAGLSAAPICLDCMLDEPAGEPWGPLFEPPPFGQPAGRTPRQPATPAPTPQPFLPGLATG